MSVRQKHLAHKASTLPRKPGCYLMKEKTGGILYVGKAKNLRSRVGSYFNESAKSPKTEILVSRIDDFDFIITSTDVEAFVLENNLIKKHAPKYNIRLRDDKSYPYIYVDYNEPFPRIQYGRRVKRQGGRIVFGPFVQGSHISEVLRILVKSFRLRDCTLREFHSRKRPCLLYQMHQCSAPCVGKISDDDYLKDLEIALDIFKGKGRATLSSLTQKMHGHAQREEFEQAAMIRDFIETLEKFIAETHQQENAEVSFQDKDLDICAYHIGDVEIDVAIYMIREGVLLGHKSLHFPNSIMTTEGDDRSEINHEFLSFLFQYYSSSFDSLPKKIVLNIEKSMRALFEKALKSSDAEEMSRISVVGPGQKYSSLMTLTEDYAKESQRVRFQNQEGIKRGLNELKILLKLKEVPRLLECYDVAIWQGESPTASQIVFYDGKADKKRYRHYHLEKRPEGNNDFEMLREMMRRRIPHGDLPDVMIVDGGKGQVSALCEVLKELDCNIPVVGIAKSRANKKESFDSVEVSRSQERLIIPGRSNPYILSKNPSLFRIIVQMRDESHRFSRRLHHKAENERIFHSWLDDIVGVGPKTKEKVLSRLTFSPSELDKMSVEEIQKTFEISFAVAQKILDHWKS